MSGSSATVYVGDHAAATMERTRHGSEFRYLPAYLEAMGGDPRAAVARYGIPERAVTRMLDDLCRKLAEVPSRLDEIGLSDKRTRQLGREMIERGSRLE